MLEAFGLRRRFGATPGPVAGGDGQKRAGIADTAGRAAIYPARVAARAWRAPLESAAEDVLSAPEIARVVDRALAGPLPEELARSLVRHRVVERIVGELARTGELERLIGEALDSQQTVELTDRVLASDEMQRTLRNVASSPEVRRAVTRQSVGLLQELADGLRSIARRLDDAVERLFHRSAHPGRSPYGGVASRAVALAADSLLALAIFATGSALIAVIASLVGGIHPHWVAGTVLGFGWIVVAMAYFVLFWSTVGQTPGMRLMHLRVERRTGGTLSTFRAIVRTVGLGLSILVLFLGFVPALFDPRRRALPDFLAGSVVVYDQAMADTWPT